MESILLKCSNFVVGLLEWVAENIFSWSFLIEILIVIFWVIMFMVIGGFIFVLKSKYFDEWWNKKASKPEGWVRKYQHFIVALGWGFFLWILLGKIWQSIPLIFGGLCMYLIGHGAGKRGY
jgi:hypothetical protein